MRFFSVNNEGTLRGYIVFVNISHVGVAFFAELSWLRGAASGDAVVARAYRE